MKHVIMFYETAADFEARQDPAKAEGYWGAWGAYVQALQSSGIVVNGEGLQPPFAATTVRLKDGHRQVQDGPYADTKEQLGGFFVIDVPTIDVALEWAARAPSAPTGGVEVRPVLPPPAR